MTHLLTISNASFINSLIKQNTIAWCVLLSQVRKRWKTRSRLSVDLAQKIWTHSLHTVKLHHNTITTITFDWKGDSRNHPLNLLLTWNSLLLLYRDDITFLYQLKFTTRCYVTFHACKCEQRYPLSYSHIHIDDPQKIVHRKQFLHSSLLNFWRTFILPKASRFAIQEKLFCCIVLQFSPFLRFGSSAHAIIFVSNTELMGFKLY